MPPAPILDPATIDTTNVVFDLEEIRSSNPQRFEMEQLCGIVHWDTQNHILAGYQDITAEKFWVRGHMPGYPLMPGVLMCETAAQLCSFYSHRSNLLESGFIGFGGLEDVRFRGQVRPGDRLLIVAKAVRLHRRQTIFECQAFVGENMVFHGRVIGVPIPPLDKNEGSASE